MNLHVWNRWIVSEGAVNGMLQQHGGRRPHRPTAPPSHLLQVDVNDQRAHPRRPARNLRRLRRPCGILQRLRRYIGTPRRWDHLQATHRWAGHHSWRKSRYPFLNLTIIQLTYIISFDVILSGVVTCIRPNGYLHVQLEQSKDIIYVPLTTVRPVLPAPFEMGFLNPSKEVLTSTCNLFLALLLLILHLSPTAGENRLKNLQRFLWNYLC